MPYGRGYGMGRGFGMGGGFRGSYAAWPYIGRGRGGLPRCGYFFAGQPYLPPGYTTPLPDNLSALKDEAAYLQEHMAQVQAKISELEQQKTT